MSSESKMLGKRSRSDIAARMFKKMRAQIQARPRTRTPKPGQFEGVRNGVAISGSAGPEIKNFDNQTAALAVTSAAPTIDSMLSDIAEGVTSVTRVGAKILLRSLDIELNATCTGGSAGVTGPQNAIVDVLVVWDKQPNGAVPTVGSILVSTDTNLTFGNLANLERFVVLRRKSFALSADHPAEVWREHIPLQVASRYADTTGPPLTNDIYIVCISPNGATSTTVIGPQIDYVARVKFVDA